MSELKVKGTIVNIGETIVVSEKFQKREFVVNDNSMYPQEIQFQVIQDKCTLLDMFTVGQDAEVSFNLRGRKWTNPEGVDKWFNTLEAWRIEGAEGVVNQSTEAEVDDLPF